jgi:hypothetical protein
MSTATQSGSIHEKARAKHLSDVETHEREIAKANDRLAEIKTERENRDHLEKLLDRNAGAIRTDEGLAKEQATLEREISTRRRLIEDSRSAAEKLKPEIERAKGAETADVIERAFVNFENARLALNPLLDGLRDEFSKFDSGRVELEQAVSQFPDWAKTWTGNHFLQEFGDRFRAAVVAEVQQIVSGKKDSFGPAFPATASDIFDRMHQLLKTIAATAAGGGEGRRMYRASNGAISGVSGGLNLRHGDVICLEIDDPETQKLISMGVLEPVTEEK